MSSKLISLLQDTKISPLFVRVIPYYCYQVSVWQLIMSTELKKKDILEFSRDDIASWLADR